MRPAFSSTGQAAAFAALLLLLLGLPLLLRGPLLPPRQELYDYCDWKWGPYPWNRSQIFDETNEADIIFLGSSHMACSFDTPYVEARLSEQLGRPAVVRSLTWSGADFDVLYLVARDLLQHRHVRMLVIYDETLGLTRNVQVPLLFRWGEDSGTVAALPLKDRANYYFASVMGVPRNLLCWLRPNIPADLSRHNWYMDYYQTPNPATRLGASTRHLGYAPMGAAGGPFQPFTPTNGTGPADTCRYGVGGGDAFTFSRASLPAWQRLFAQRVAALAKEHDSRLVLVHLPVLAETNATSIVEKEYWPDLLQAEVAMVGVPPAKFFAGLTPEQARLLYADPGHFNENGQKYFTPLVTPTLLQLYEELPRH